MKNLKKILLTITLTTIAIIAMSVTSKGATVQITTELLNVRKEASQDSKVIAVLSEGDQLEATAEEGDWYQIKFKNETGYISKKYSKIIEGTVKKVEQNDDNSKNEVTEPEENTSKGDSNANTNQNKPIDNEGEQTENKVQYKKINKDTEIKILPLIHSKSIENIKKNTQILFITKASGWSYIQTDLVSGWVRNEFLDEEFSKQTSDNKEQNKELEETYTEKTGYINEEYVNVRSGAGTNYKIIKILTLNSQVTIIGEDGDWYNVKSGNDKGYISKELVSDSRKVTTRGNNNQRTENKEDETVITKESNNLNLEAQTTNDETNSEAKSNKNITNVVKTETKKETSKIKGTDIVAYAKKYLGYKYVYGGDGSNGTFDCSGFTMYVYKHFGISLRHGANAQYNCGKGTIIKKQSDLKTGDIVFLTDYETGVGIGHCGIYIDNGNFIHASTTTYSVIISSLNTMYKGRFYAGLRLI